jgi:transcriptional regulator with XRE-family HTH domain
MTRRAKTSKGSRLLGRSCHQSRTPAVKVARALGVSRSAVSQWIKGTATPAARHREELSKLLGISVAAWELLHEVQVPPHGVPPNVNGVHGDNEQAADGALPDGVGAEVPVSVSGSPPNQPPGQVSATSADRVIERLSAVESRFEAAIDEFLPSQRALLESLNLQSLDLPELGRRVLEVERAQHEVAEQLRGVRQGLEWVGYKMRPGERMASAPALPVRDFSEERIRTDANAAVGLQVGEVAAKCMLELARTIELDAQPGASDYAAMLMLKLVIGKQGLFIADLARQFEHLVRQHPRLPRTVACFVGNCIVGTVEGIRLVPHGPKVPARL